MTLGERVFLVCRVLNRLLTQQVADATDRPILHLRALHAIEREHVRTQVALAERLLIDPPAVSRLVDRLDDEGLIQRVPGEDRRCTGVTVTDAALPHIASLRTAYDHLDEELGKHLTARELKTLQALLEKIHRGVQATQG